MFGLKQPGILVGAPASIAVASEQDVQVAAQRNLSVTTGKNTDLSVAKRFTVAAGELVSIFAAKLGIKLFAARGPVEIQAQNDAMSLFADKDVHIASVDGKVHISAAKELVLECGGAFIQLKDGSVTISAPLDLIYKVITLQKQGKAQMNTPMPQSGPPSVFDEQVRVVDQRTGDPISSLAYFIKTQNGETYSGHTDDKGLCQRVTTSSPEELTVWLGKEAEEQIKTLS